jgi:hypothetical protein
VIGALRVEAIPAVEVGRLEAMDDAIARDDRLLARPHRRGPGFARRRERGAGAAHDDRRSALVDVHPVVAGAVDGERRLRRVHLEGARHRELAQVEGRVAARELHLEQLGGDVAQLDVRRRAEAQIGCGTDLDLDAGAGGGEERVAGAERRVDARRRPLGHSGAPERRLPVHEGQPRWRPRRDSTGGLRLGEARREHRDEDQDGRRPPHREGLRAQGGGVKQNGDFGVSGPGS